jgi:hypothetical protein
MESDQAHRLLLREVPELGHLFGFDEVLGNFGQFLWEQHLAGRQDVVARGLAYVEWLHQHESPEVADRALRAFFKGVPWPSSVVDQAGPATTAALLAADWFEADDWPPALRPL